MKSRIRSGFFFGLTWALFNKICGFPVASVFRDAVSYLQGRGECVPTNFAAILGTGKPHILLNICFEPGVWNILFLKLFRLSAIAFSASAFFATPPPGSCGRRRRRQRNGAGVKRLPLRSGLGTALRWDFSTSRRPNLPYFKVSAAPPDNVFVFLKENGENVLISFCLLILSLYICTL